MAKSASTPSAYRLQRYTVGFDASAKIKRTEFGVSTLVPLISDDVDIIISAAFERQI
jgi:polyisoprenoid-binding protein YceI